MKSDFQLEIIEERESYFSKKYDTLIIREVISATLDLYKQIGFHKPWVGYLVVGSDGIVGAAGFNGVPVNNIVEISYFTFPGYEGKGYATLACHELVKIARNQNQSLNVCAKTAPEENASTRILRKNGFVYNRVVQDHEIGDAWLWELASF